MNSFDFVLKVFLFLAPIFYWGNLPLAQTQLQFFQLGVIFLFFVALSQKKQRDLKDKTLFALGFVCFLNIFIAPTPYSRMALVNIVFLLLLYYLIVCYAKNVRCILKTLVLLSAINAILGLSQRFGLDFVYDTSSGSCAFMGTSAFHGDFQAIIFPIALYLHPLMAIFPVMGLVLSKSATAGMATVVGLAFIAAKKRFGSIHFLAILSGMTIFIVHFRDQLLRKLIMRTTIWKKALELIFDKPLQGWGFGSIFGMTDEFCWPQYGTADRLYNDYLEFGLCVGIVGCIFLFIFFCNKVKRYRRADKTLLLNTVFAGCIVASAICLSHSPMAPIFSGIGQSPRIAIVIITMFALLEIQLQGGGGEKRWKV